MNADLTSSINIRRIRHLSEEQIHQLADVLIDCVAGGASVSFMNPLTLEKAAEFWRKVAADTQRGARALIVAEDQHGIVGTVQLVLEQTENQPHRADLSKMLVHRRGRRLGVGARLMQAAETEAKAEAKSVLVLDTADDTAARLYSRLGWTLAGTIPDYALLPDGGLCATSYYYRRLA